jgi:serine/threonine-protein kinase
MARALELDSEAWDVLRRLLDEALALPRPERAGWLRRLDDAHAALKPHLERLLAHAEDDAGLARFDALPGLAGAGPDLPAALPPPVIGPYRAIRLLAEGGMSSVWLAERTDLLRKRPVALKLPHATWRGEGLAQRMAQEREILGRLDHPNIARIYDAGVDDDGQPWLALEYVEGEPIDAWCRARGLGPRAIVALVLQVCDAVAHAHARLVVHRDLKPANILVAAHEPAARAAHPAAAPGRPAREDAAAATTGVVRLLDFGIAKLVGGARAEAAELTLDAPQPRTPWYAAPEQLLGEPVSAATDIYALGVVLYELLAGERPYRPARPTPAALEEAILHAEPARPSTVVADRARARALRDDLDTIVLKALRKAPSERYRSVTELADDLERWLAALPVRARPDGARYRALKFVHRHRIALAFAGTLALTLCAGLAAALWQAGRAQQEAAKALAIKDYLVGLFEASDVEQQDALRRRQQSVQQLLEGSAGALPAALAGQPEVRDELERVVGRLLDQLELTEAAVRLRRQRVAQLEALQADPDVRVDALTELATSERAHGEVAAARATLARAEALCTTAGRTAGAPCLVARTELGRVDFAERRLAPALARVEPAARALREAAPGSLALANALDLLGLLRAETNRDDEAIALFEESLALRRAAWGADSVRYAIARYRFGVDLWARRHLARAEGEMRAAWATVAAALGPAHVGTARIEMDLGRLTYYVGLRDDGLEHLRRASETLVREAGRVDPHEVLAARTTLANALVLDGQLAEAGAELERALALRDGLDPAAWADPTLDQSYARWLLDQGRFAAARAWLERMRARAIAIQGERHPDVADRGVRIAWAWIAEGRLDEAQREIERVLATAGGGAASFGSVQYKAQLARVGLLLEQGRAAEARPLVEAQLAAAERTPRADQLRDVLFQLDDLAARTAAQCGDPAGAARLFERAIALLPHVDARHPYLAAARARYASLLAQDGDLAGARRQIELARPAFEAHPAPGEQFQRPWRAALQSIGAPALPRVAARGDPPARRRRGRTPSCPGRGGGMRPPR